MKLLTKRTIWLLLLAGFPQLALAQADSLSPDVNNPSLGSETGGLTTALGNATVGQFSSFSGASGTIGRSPAQAAANATAIFPELPSEFPRNANLRLIRSTVGATFSAAIPDYFIGDIIATPSVVFTDGGTGIDRPLRREPVRATEGSFFYRVQGNSLATFVPSATVDERFFYSPHAALPVRTVPGEDYESIGDDSDEIREGFVYASQSGVLNLYYRTANPVGQTAQNVPIYGLTSRRVFIAAGTLQQPRRIFWTEVPFEAPAIQLGSSEVQEIRFSYYEDVPAFVPREDAYIPDPNNPPAEEFYVETKTIWHDLAQKKISAMNVEGRIVIELLGEQRSTNGPVLRRQIGIEVVDIVKQAIPYQVDVPLGERLYPLRPEQDGQQNYPLPQGDFNRQLAQERIVENLEEFSPSLVLNLPGNAGDGFFTGQFEVDGQLSYYAQRKTETPADVLVYWKEDGIAGLEWPKFLNRYRQYWPEDLGDYVVNIRPSDRAAGPGTLPIFDDAVAFELISQDDPEGRQANRNNILDFEVTVDGSDPTNRSLILLRAEGEFWFVRVESVLDSFLMDPRYADYFRDKDEEDNILTAFVGERLTPPAGAGSRAAWVDLSKGDAIDASAYIDPFATSIPEAEAGAVIPVNAAPKKGDPNLIGDNNMLDVWWFDRRDSPEGKGLAFPPIYFPSYFTRYELVWPQDAPAIVLAEGAGSGDLNAAAAAAGTIYTQNDPTLVGYNPNEEHAILSGNRAYALRDDLNLSDTTSSPYVLVRYTAPDQRPEIDVFRVLRTDENYDFDYEAVAGRKLGAPAPLSFLPIPLVEESPGQFISRNEEVDTLAVDLPFNLPSPRSGEFASYDRFLFEDRKGEKWVYRGPHDPDNLTVRPKLGIKYYYATLDGFSFPSATDGSDEAPPSGTLTPFLREPDGGGGFSTPRYDGDGGPSVALTVQYTPYWPDRAPDNPALVRVLPFGDTLVKPKYEIPGIAGATSAEIFYQQSIAKDLTAETESVIIHDPTRRKIYPLSETTLVELPPSISTSTRGGRTYFEGLPPHLEQRFYYDPTLPTDGGLVLEGEFVEAGAGEDYVLLNVLSLEEVDLLKALASAETDPTSWEDAIDGLSTTMETFVPSLTVPGTYEVDVTQDLSIGVGEISNVTSSDVAVDSYAVSAIGGGEGYVTLVYGNGKAFTPEGDSVEIRIFKVGEELYRGEVKPLTAANPLSEIVTAQFTGDFAGQPEKYEYEWFYAPPANGQPPQNVPRGPGVTWFRFGDNETGPRMIFGGLNPVIALSDNYVIFRYRPKAGEGHPLEEVWSEWTEPKLIEGWIKRVLAGINPFNQRLTDFFNNPINTDVSLLTQAGGRWEGDLPLTLDSVGGAGLIEIYETVLRRGISFTINGSPATDYGPANDALLLAAGYLADLYLAVGNEAFADASNPLIALDVDPGRLLQDQGLPSSIGTTIQNTATSRFAFEGQVPELIDEELILLRGRDDSLAPGVRVSPVYNRFFWNFTRGIDAGEVIYALNYNIKEKTGNDADGKIDASDALRQYPQGHGDAYGHYLTSLTNYYRLLSDDDFTWTPRVEAVNILGQPVTVDYLDERRLARAAAALGRTSSRILDLGRRQLSADAASGWSELRESKVNTKTMATRSWGVEQWASRAGQGNYLHWMMGNALLPEEDTINEGLQKIDRQSVPELNELSTLGAEIQGHLDQANNRTNALGLAENSLLFDLSPSGLDEGESHFDQILARAKTALANLSVAHARTIANNGLLRSVENQADDYNFTVAQEETALTNRLLDIYGTPYAGDIGPGRAYPQNYGGPDFSKYFFITRPYVYPREQVFGSDVNERVSRKLPVRNSEFQNLIGGIDDLLDGNISEVDDESYFRTIPYEMNLNDGPYQFATAEQGRRASTGSVQDALAQVMTAEEIFFLKIRSLSSAQAAYKRSASRFRDQLSDRNDVIVLEEVFGVTKKTVNRVLEGIDLFDVITNNTKKTYEEILAATLTSLPRMVGFSNDVTSAARGALLASKVAGNTVISATEITKKVVKFGTAVGFDLAEFAKNTAVRTINENAGVRSAALALQNDYKAVFSGIRDADLSLQEYQRALENYRNKVVDGDTVQAERESFRNRAAAIIQGSRIRDVAFRAFRTESLEQYKILFDQAARYTYLAAKAYDYETGLLGSADGQAFLSKIVETRALGLVSAEGEPLFAGASSGDPGLSSLLAQLEQDWDVAKGRLGINNPDQYGTTVSLRREFFELPFKEDGSTDGDDAWRDALKASLVADLRSDSDIAAHALSSDNANNLPQPGFIISFPTTIEDGKNLFGKELRAGDSAFSSTSFSTKIHSVGIVFEGYKGIDPCITCNFGTPEAPNHDHPDALSATPYVYFLPVGSDTMRTPSINGNPSVVREWLVHDHALPLPFNIGGNGASQNTVWNSNTSLTEDYFVPRRHQAFRAFDETELFVQPLADEFTNSRLIGRSVWNSEWKLVIPAQALLANPDEGIERFVKSVKDIKIFFRTYSHAGN